MAMLWLATSLFRLGLRLMSASSTAVLQSALHVFRRSVRSTLSLRASRCLCTTAMCRDVVAIAFDACAHSQAAIFLRFRPRDSADTHRNAEAADAALNNEAGPMWRTGRAGQLTACPL